MVYCVAYTPVESSFPVYGGFWAGAQEAKINYMGTWDVEVIDERTRARGADLLQLAVQRLRGNRTSRSI